MSIDKKTFMNQPLEPEQEKRWRLARREDLATVYGVTLSVPFHGQDESGIWRYGLRPFGGFANPEFVDEFESEMRSLIVESSSPLVDAGILSPRQIGAIQGHGYETGPAAQSWPQFFFEIYQQSEPFISGSADLIAVAEFIRQVAERVRNWRVRKEDEIKQDQREAFDRTMSIDLDPHLTLTLPILVALCAADLDSRYGKSGDIDIEIFPRMNTFKYATAGHPMGSETYLLRFKTGTLHYYYLVNGRGRVMEHYLTAGDELTLLPLADLLPVEHSGTEYRDAEQPRHGTIRFGNVLTH